jgi:hypothetical protein
MDESSATLQRITPYLTPDLILMPRPRTEQQASSAKREHYVPMQVIRNNAP